MPGILQHSPANTASYARLSSLLLIHFHYGPTAPKGVQNLSDMCRTTLAIGAAQCSSVTAEIAPHFRAGAKLSGIEST